jgi:hypothetical protein
VRLLSELLGQWAVMLLLLLLLLLLGGPPVAAQRCLLPHLDRPACACVPAGAGRPAAGADEGCWSPGVLLTLLVQH